MDCLAKNTRTAKQKCEGDIENGDQISVVATPIKGSVRKIKQETPKTPQTPKMPRALGRSTPRRKLAQTPQDTGSGDIRNFLSLEHLSTNFNPNLSAIEHDQISVGSNSQLGASCSDIHSFCSALDTLNTSNTSNERRYSANKTFEFETTLEWEDKEGENPCANMSRDNAQDVNTLQQETANTLTDNRRATITEDQEVIFNRRESSTPHHNIGKSSEQHNIIPQLDLGKMGENITNTEVVNMFQTLMTQMASMQTQLSSQITAEKDRNTVKFNTIDKQLKADSISAEKVKTNVNANTVRLNKLVDVIQRQDHLISELTDKVEYLQHSQVSPNLVIHGVTEKADENCVETAKDFFKTSMGIEQEIKVKTAYRIGKSKNKPLLIVLKQASSKGIIYKHVKNLKGKTNEYEKAYRIEDQLPPRKAEEQRKVRHLMWRNKHKTPVADRLKASVEKGKLLVDNQELRNPLINPKGPSLLKLKPDELIELGKLEVRRGTTIQCEASKFTGYVADIASFEDANKAYKWVKYQNMDVRHIMAVAKIQGVDSIENCAFEDDSEHGGGVTVLECLDKAEIEGHAVFVTRHYDGDHIGSQRFNCITRAAKSTLNQKPFNTVTNEFQFSWEKVRGRKQAKGRGGQRNWIPHVDELSSSNAATATSSSDSEEEVKQ